jgi:hypothetical protein
VRGRVQPFSERQPAVSVSTALSSCGSWFGSGWAGVATVTSGASPMWWIQRLSGVSHFAIGQLERAVVLELDPLLDRALAERRLTDELGPVAILERARDDLARRCAALVDEDDELDLVGRGEAARRRVGLDLLALGVLFPEDRPGADELRRDPPGGRHVAAGIAAEVEDDLRLAGVEVGLQRVMELARGVVEKPVTWM